MSPLKNDVYYFTLFMTQFCDLTFERFLGPQINVSSSSSISILSRFSVANSLLVCSSVEARLNAFI